MRNNFIPYGKQRITKNDISAVAEVLKSNWITQGPRIAKFEKLLTKYCGAKYAVAVSSGTAALHLACLVAGLKKGDEAITTPITFVATVNSILYTGAKPVFADIDFETGNLDPLKAQKAITKKTKVVLPVHFAGLPCDMEAISKIAKSKRLIVIEDACHALGAEQRYNKRWIKIGSCMFSDMAVFSFHPIKSITTGEGGAVLCNRKDLYERLLMLRNHGIIRKRQNFKNKDLSSACSWYYEMQLLGFNYRITDFQCALGISQLKKIEDFIEKRRRIAEKYKRYLSFNPYFDLPIEKKDVRSSWHLYPIRLKEKYTGLKKDIFNTLRKKGIGVQVHYLPAYLHPYYKKLGYRKGLCPKGEEFYKREISIPIYPSMHSKDVAYVIKVLEKQFNWR